MLLYSVKAVLNRFIIPVLELKAVVTFLAKVKVGMNARHLFTNMNLNKVIKIVQDAVSPLLLLPCISLCHERISEHEENGFSHRKKDVI